MRGLDVSGYTCVTLTVFPRQHKIVYLKPYRGTSEKGKADLQSTLTHLQGSNKLKLSCYLKVQRSVLI